MKLGELANVRTGLVLSRKQFEPTNNTKVKYKQLNLKSILESGNIDISQLDIFIANENLKWEYLTHEGDIIVRLSHPYTAVLITKENEGLIIPSHFVTIRTNRNRLLPEYLCWLLNTQHIKNDISQNNSGTLGTIKPTYFAELTIHEISISSQQKVANVNFMAKIEVQLLEKLIEQKRLYYKLLTNEIQKDMRRGKK